MKNLLILLIVTLLLSNTFASNVDQLTEVQSGLLTLSSVTGATNYLFVGGTYQINFSPAFASNPTMAFAIAQFSTAVNPRYQISLTASPTTLTGVNVIVAAVSNTWNTFTYSWLASVANQIVAGSYIPSHITATPITNSLSISTFNLINTDQQYVKFDVFIVGFDISPPTNNPSLVISSSLPYSTTTLGAGQSTLTQTAAVTSDLTLSYYNQPLVYTTGPNTWRTAPGSQYADYVFRVNSGSLVTSLTSSSVNFPVSGNAVTASTISIQIQYSGILNSIQLYYYVHPVILNSLVLTTGFNTFTTTSSSSQNLFTSYYNKNNLGSLNSVAFYGFTNINILPTTSADATIILTGTTSTIKSIGSTITSLTAAYYFYQAAAPYCPNTLNVNIPFNTATWTVRKYNSDTVSFTPASSPRSGYYSIQTKSSGAATLVSSAITVTANEIYSLSIEILDQQGCSALLWKTTRMAVTFGAGQVTTSTSLLNVATSSSGPYFVNPQITCGSYTSNPVDNAYRFYSQRFIPQASTVTITITLTSNSFLSSGTIYVKNLNIYKLSSNHIIDPNIVEASSSAVQSFYNFQISSSDLHRSSFAYYNSFSSSISNAIALTIQNGFPISFGPVNNFNLAVATTYTLQFYILDSAGNIPANFASPTLSVNLNGATQLFSQTATLSNPFSSSTFISPTVLIAPVDNLYIHYSITFTTGITSNHILFTLSDLSNVDHIYWIRDITLAAILVFDPVSRLCVSACPTNSYLNSNTQPPACQICTAQGLVATAAGCQCPISTYYDTVSTTCKNCLYSCRTCAPGSTSTCLTCLPNRSLSITLICQCNDGFTEINNVCVSCSPSCLTCRSTATTCLSCNQGRTLNIALAVCTCPTGTYDDGVHPECQACPINCQSCSLINNVVACTGCYSSTGNFRLTTVSNNNCPCIPGYTQNIPQTRQCQICFYTCATCNGPTINNCMTCATGTNRTLFPSPSIPGGNICPCNYGYADLGIPTCTLTSCTFTYACTNCVNNVCTQCDSNLFRVLNTTTYTCNCIPGYYQNNNNVCVQCPLGCTNCTSESYCTGCITFAVFSSGNCNCLQGYYPNSASSSCVLCPIGCATCTSVSNCGRCSSGFNLNAGSCLCDSGTYLTVSGCQRCPLNTATCGSAGIPITCAVNYYLYNNNCISACPLNTYISAFACVACPSSCATCTGPTTCLTCVPSKLLSSGSCVTTCPLNTFQSGLLCSSCHNSCSSCRDGTNSGCTSCSDPTTYLLSGSCVSSCPQSTTVINGACIPCDPSCLTCLGSTTTCTSCRTSFYLYVNTQTCVASCPTGTYQILNTCSSNCPARYFINGSLCSPCSQVCDQCRGSSTNCTACPALYYVYNGNCLNTCPSGTVAVGSAGSPSCQPCDSSCNGCSVSNPSNCIDCASGFQKTTLGTCIPLCTGNTYFNGTNCPSCSANCLACTSNTYCTRCSGSTVLQNNQCYSCISPCATCSANSATSCLTCISSYGLSGSNCVSTCPNGQSISDGICKCVSGLIFNGVCVNTCPVGTTQVGNQCQICTSNCATCQSSVSSCTSCLTGFRLLGGSCVLNNDCPYGQGRNPGGSCVNLCPSNTYYSPNGFCGTSCFDNYVINSDQNACVLGTTPTCPRNQYIYQNQCVQNCPSGTYISNSNCLSCSQNCAQCLSGSNCRICINGFVVSNGACVSSTISCPSGQFKLANTCVSFCPIGTYAEGNYCQFVCAQGTLFIPSQGFCRQTCPDRTRKQGYACVV